MGAYFQAALPARGVMYDTHAMNNGLKLMEHSYMGNDYVLGIMELLNNNAQQLVWLCDYHKADKNCKYTWDEMDDLSVKLETTLESNNYFIINHTKKVFIDMRKLDEEYNSIGMEWKIHPLPILCNSDEQSMGGGDFHKEDSRRATWCMDEIEVALLVPTEFLDVSQDCMFGE